MKLLRDLRILQNPSFSCFNSSNLNWGFLLISVYWFCYCRFLNFCYFCSIDSYYFSMKRIIHVFIFIFCCFHSFLNCSYMYIYLDIYIYIYIYIYINFACLYMKMSNKNLYKNTFFYLKSVIFRFVQKP